MGLFRQVAAKFRPCGSGLAGGIAAKNPLCVGHPAFFQELGMVADAGGVVAGTPICLITDGNSGLWGAARAVAEYLPGRAPSAG